jgi:hypothetical protein
MYLCRIKIKQIKFTVMETLISKQLIRKFDSNSILLDLIEDNNESLPIKDWIQKYKSIVPPQNIVWLLLRKEFLSEKDLRLFGIWCARQALKFVKNPDIRSIEACNISEKFANGQATKEELNAAFNAAYTAYTDAAAIYAAATSDADAAYSPDIFATYSAVMFAADDAAGYASNYTYDAAYYDIDATSDAAYYSKIDQLLTYFE